METIKDCVNAIYKLKKHQVEDEKILLSWIDRLELLEAKVRRLEDFMCIAENKPNLDKKKYTSLDKYKNNIL